MSNSNQNIETPDVFVRAMEQYLDIKFKYDMAGTEANKKAPIVFTEEQDSLSIDWPKDGWCFLNPPFITLTKWVDKCWIESRKDVKIVSIWPLSGDLNQIKSWSCSDVHVIHGRLWPEVRGLMMCKWEYGKITGIKGLRWNKKELKEVWLTGEEE